MGWDFLEFHPVFILSIKCYFDIKKLRICLTFLTITFNFYRLTIPLRGVIIYEINYILLNNGEL